MMSNNSITIHPLFILENSLFTQIYYVSYAYIRHMTVAYGGSTPREVAAPYRTNSSNIATYTKSWHCKNTQEIQAQEPANNHTQNNH